MSKLKECPTCGEDFKPKRSTQKYCSTTCQHSGAIKIVSSTCQRDGCDVIFEDKPSSKKKYCSRSCAAKVNNVLTPKRKPEGQCYLCSGVCPSSRKYCNKCLTSIHIEGKPELTKNCSHCSAEFKTHVKNKKFCSKSCKNTFSRIHSNYDVDLSDTCKGCGGPKSKRSLMCFECKPKFNFQKKIDSWLSGEWDGSSGLYLSSSIRRYLIEKNNYSCQGCGFNTPHPSDGASILEVDHIDGNGVNHSPDNLRVLCPNCHALTPTYRSRNIGKGRNQYYLKINKDNVEKYIRNKSNPE